MSSAVHQIQREEAVYDSLYELKPYSESIPIYVQEGNEKIKRTILRVLGSGGSKRAYELEDGKALLMTYGSSLSVIANSKKWPEMVDEEIMATKRVKELGLLACDLKKVNVFMTADSILSVTAYQTETFSQLSTKGIWIIDQKNPRSSTWKKTFFHENVDRYDEKNWEKLLIPFLKDIAKLLLNNFWLYRDNVNIAVLEKQNHVDNISGYEIRYFGFDFSSKDYKLSFKTLSNEEIFSIVRSIIADSLYSLIDCEFGKDYSQKRDDLYHNLKEKSLKAFTSEVDSPDLRELIASELAKGDF